MAGIPYHQVTSLLGRHDVFESASEQGSSIVTAVVPLIIVTTVFVGLRIFSKITYRKPFSRDDYVLIAALVLMAVAAGLLFECVALGMGQKIADIHHDRRPKVVMYLVLGGQFAIAGGCLAQISIALTLLGIARSKRQRLILWGIVATVVLTKVLSMILMFTACQPIDRLWNQYHMAEAAGFRACQNVHPTVSFWIFACVWYSCVDLVLVALAWYIIRKLQMKPLKKFGLGISFGAGIFSAITATLEAVHVLDGNYDGDVTQTNQVVWTFAGPSVVIMAACVPFLHKLAQDVIKSLRLDKLRGFSALNRLENNSASSEPVPLRPYPGARVSAGFEDDGRSDRTSSSRPTPEAPPRAHLSEARGRAGVSAAAASAQPGQWLSVETDQSELTAWRNGVLGCVQRG
ncbi:hypothetical protein QBC37DRAFT_389743 [Rhypophila decipiens]|uniref:Rhodopsin domain-containing protein n=1 Tax=Rhypophila decipiens TaxID=261697 RepID=A0AAN6Y2N9_9PEZI|nr:hypothetical protein QBC37DRAFT_389743 [Rhypophila decipiens]